MEMIRFENTLCFDDVDLLNSITICVLYVFDT